jgi:hypothetical protein
MIYPKVFHDIRDRKADNQTWKTMNEEDRINETTRHTM